MSSAEIRLLLVSRSDGSYGAVEAFVLDLAEALRRESGIAVRICLRRTRAPELQPNLKAMLRGIDVTFADRTFDRDLINEIRAADVVHMHNALPEIAFLARVFRKRIVITVHNEVHTLAERMTLPLADVCWYSSQYLWDKCEPRRKRARSRKLWPMLPLAEDAIALEKRRGFVFAGRWVADKGIETLLDAYALAKLDRERWPLALMGDGPLRQLIEYAIQKRQISGVRVLGFCDDATKVHEMKKARWLVVPSSAQEGYSRAALEARRVGLPCIVTPAGGLPESAGGQALIAQSTNPHSLAAILERAAAMNESEYNARAKGAQDELLVEMEPIEFYRDAYRRLVRK